IHGERRIGSIIDFDGQESAVVETREVSDDAAVFDFPLADADLELLGRSPRVAQVNVTNIWEDLIVALPLVRSSNVMTWVERQSRAGNLLTQFHRCVRKLGERAHPRFHGKDYSFLSGEANQFR